MTFCLESTIIKPENGSDIKNAVILLHGYGGVFLCPNGHEPCKINPIGYQWFDLETNDKNYILNEVKKAEDKLRKYIEEVKAEYNLENSKICLSGGLNF